MSRAIFFDLDGTLTDSGPGIINCAQLALAHFGIQVPDRDQLRVFVGPPLRQSFARFGVPPASLDEAIARFRARYVPIGKFENTPYPGIAGLLDRLQGAGYRLFVATSKPQVTAQEVLEHSSWPVTSSASAGPPWTQAGRPRRTSSPIFSPRSATPARW